MSSILYIKTDKATCYLKKDNSKWLSVLQSAICEHLDNKYINDKALILCLINNTKCLKTLDLLVRTFVNPLFPISWIIAEPLEDEPLVEDEPLEDKTLEPLVEPLVEPFITQIVEEVVVSEPVVEEVVVEPLVEPEVVEEVVVEVVEEVVEEVVVSEPVVEEVVVEPEVEPLVEPEVEPEVEVVEEVVELSNAEQIALLKKQIKVLQKK